MHDGAWWNPWVHGFHSSDVFIKYIISGNTRTPFFLLIGFSHPAIVCFSNLHDRKELREQSWQLDGWAETVYKVQSTNHLMS